MPMPASTFTLAVGYWHQVAADIPAALEKGLGRRAGSDKWPRLGSESGEQTDPGSTREAVKDPRLQTARSVVISLLSTRYELHSDLFVVESSSTVTVPAHSLVRQRYLRRSCEESFRRGRAGLAVAGPRWAGLGSPLGCLAAWCVCQWFPVIPLLPSRFSSCSSPAVARCRPQESATTRKPFISSEWLEGDLEQPRYRGRSWCWI